MATTSTRICNYALEYIGRRTIASLTESSREAKVCNTFYDMARQSVLRDHKWGFATRSITLAAVTATDYVGWDYAYTYPTDALYADKIYTGSSTSTTTVGLSQVTGHIPFTIESNEAKNKKYVLTNQEEAVLIYTADATEENLFDSLFIEALSYKIAATIIIPLKAELSLQQSMNQLYGMAIAKAKASDSNERYEAPTDDNSILNARL